MGASYLARPQCSAAGPGPMFPAKGFPPYFPRAQGRRQGNAGCWGTLTTVTCTDAYHRS